MSEGKQQDRTPEQQEDREKSSEDAQQEAGAALLQEAFDVFSRASLELQKSYDELKVRADRLAKELASTNEELQRQLVEKERIGNFLSNIVQSIRSGIVVVAPDRTISLINERAGEMFQLEGEAEGRDFHALFGHSPVALFLDECLDDPDATPRTVELELTPASGGRMIYSVAFSPVRDRSGEQVASLLVTQDVTRLKLLEEQSLRTNRLAAMGEVAAQLAHEIRNPLGSIEIFASLLSRDLRGQDNQKLADNIVVGVKSLNAVVTNMLTFTRTISVNPEPLDFNELVEETVGFLEQMLSVQDIGLNLQLAPEVGEVEVDPELFKQVLLNLAQNSIFAMKEQAGAVLTVGTSLVRSESGQPAVEVTVADNGCGIAMEDLSKIFDPFFSTRKGGTGLGLSVVSQIIEKHGGLITADSIVGKGTAMRFTLPLTQ